MAHQVANNPQHQPVKLDQAMAALAQLDFHLNVQKTALAQATLLADQIRDKLQLDTEAEGTDLPPCVIDLAPIGPEDAQALPCGHVYHAECIGHWLGHSNTCPVCRTIVYPANEQDEEDSSDDGPEDTAAASRTSSITSVSSTITNFAPVDMALIEQLAFHHRLITEMELLAARGEELAVEGMEAQLNLRWADFLRAQIGRLYEGAERVEDAVLGTEDEGEGGGAVDGLVAD
ncbi:hypothetical protein LTR36_007918 [Oleoguttula mirabilis]|uniref:RING-type domain-containing protein n=1 Tax=Oleoguttula mirabilis TaxID=1507867 RepID=A0AAV9J8T0_9PEZI|nr:hypothetical protein LTR36_007918 [Oleoguttula mirabilis]